MLHTDHANFNNYVLSELYDKIAEYNFHQYPEDPISALDYLKDLSEKNADFILPPKEDIGYSKQGSARLTIGK